MAGAKKQNINGASEKKPRISACFSTKVVEEEEGEDQREDRDHDVGHGRIEVRA